MQKIYLDYNIIVRLHERKDEELKDLISSVDRKAFHIVYSPAHVEEIAVSRMRNDYSSEKTDEKLSSLSSLTNNIELLPFERRDVHIMAREGAYVCNEHPKQCYERVLRYYENNDYAEMLEKEFLKAASEENIYGIDPKEISNVPPDELLLGSGLDLRIQEQIFMGLLAKRELNKNQISKIMGVSDKLNGLNFDLKNTDYSIIEMAMSTVFNTLELLRYRAERKNKYRSRLHDVSHAIYAAYCDYFITEDSKLSFKTKAAYKYLHINTAVMDINGLSGVIRK